MLITIYIQVKENYSELRLVLETHLKTIRTLHVTRTGFILICALPEYAEKRRKYRKKWQGSKKRSRRVDKSRIRIETALPLPRQKEST